MAVMMTRGKSFGQRLREARDSQGLSQTDLSARTGISRVQINAMENQDVDCKLSTARKIAKALGVPVSVLTDDEEQTGDEQIDQTVHFMRLMDGSRRAMVAQVARHAAFPAPMIGASV